MLDFDVQRFSRVCAKSGRELKAGDEFFSYLTRDGTETVRKDVAADHWEGPEDECLAWWKSEVPDHKSRKAHWAPHDVMLHYFAETEDKPEELEVRYVLALLMIRRRIFRLEVTETDDDGNEIMVLYCSRNETEYQVRVASISAERGKEVQSLLSQLLVDVGSK